MTWIGETRAFAPSVYSDPLRTKKKLMGRAAPAGGSSSQPESRARSRLMHGRKLNGNWEHMKSSVLEQWSSVTAEDIAHLAGEREGLMRVLKERYQKTYGEIEREVNEFEVRQLRAGYASRPARGMGLD
jgi:uncharacterized protein YjbJ (UPF0337 family)